MKQTLTGTVYVRPSPHIHVLCTLQRVYWVWGESSQDAVCGEGRAPCISSSRHRVALQACKPLRWALPLLRHLVAIYFPTVP